MKEKETHIKLPKLKLPELDGDPLEWPEWSRLFLATVDSAPVDDSIKMNQLKTQVTGKTRAAIQGLEFSKEMFSIAMQTLVRNFRRPHIITNAQLKQIHTQPFSRSNDSQAIIKYEQVISTSVNLLTQNQ